MTRLAGIDFAAPPWVVIPVFLATLAAIALMAGRLGARWLHRSSQAGRLDRREVPALQIPLVLAIVLGGILLILPDLALPAQLRDWISRGGSVLFVVACALCVARIGIAAITEYASRHPGVAPALGVGRVAVRVAVAILAILMSLQTLGVSITPLLTTLGVGSVAVALALQDTLANFFAGLYLLADRPVRAGDYVKILDGAEGTIETIGWRSTRLRTIQNNVVVVPNQKLSQAILTNYHLPEPHLAVTFSVGVSYGADPEAVESMILDELVLAAGEVPEVHADPPSVRLSSFGDSALVFTCTVFVRDYESQFHATHQVRKRVLVRLRQEGVEIPFPQHVVHMAETPERRKNLR